MDTNRHLLLGALENFPNDWAMWLEQKAQRVAANDKLAESRVVIHDLIIPNPGARTRAKAKLQQLGYRMDKPGFQISAKVSVATFVPLSDETVAEMFSQLIPLAKEFGGKYDGFIAEVV